MILGRSWLSFALIGLICALQCASVLGDADFESVRVLMTKVCLHLALTRSTDSLLQTGQVGERW